jgi:argininosuccinate lyase
LSVSENSVSEKTFCTSPRFVGNAHPALRLGGLIPTYSQVRKGMAFRDAHEAAGLAVRLGEDTERDFSELSLDELQEFSALITADVFEYLTLEGSVAARKHIGGTAPETVKAAIATARLAM